MIRRADLLYLAAAVVAAYLLVPYGIYVHDHQFMIPFLYKTGNAALFPGDITADLFRNYSVLSFRVLLPAVQAFGLEAAFFGFHLLALIASFSAIIALARRLYPGDTPAVLLVLALLFLRKYVAGGVWTFDEALVSRHIAFPLFLWGLWAVLSERWVLAALLLAFGFDLHPVTGIWAILTATLLALPRRASWWNRRGALAIAAALIALSPAILFRGEAGGESTFQWMDAEWTRLVRLTNPDHFFWNDYDRPMKLSTLALPVLLALAASRHGDRALRIGLYAVAAAFPILLLINYYFTEVRPHQLVLLLSAMRFALFVTLLAGLALPALLRALWEEPKLRWLAVGIALPFAMEYRIRIFLACVFFLAALSVIPRLKQYFLRIPSWVLVLLFAINFLRTFRAQGTFPFSSPVAYEILLCSAALAIFALGSVRLKLFPSLAAALVAKIGLYTIFGVGIAQAQFPRLRAVNDFELAASWAREHVPENALFITGNTPGFRPLAMRSTAGNIKDGTYSNLSRAYAKTWEERLRALCRGEGIFKEEDCRYEQQDTESLRRLAEMTGATHVIVPLSHPPLELESIYENPGFRIYRIVTPAP